MHSSLKKERGYLLNHVENQIHAPCKAFPLASGFRHLYNKTFIGRIVEINQKKIPDRTQWRIQKKDPGIGNASYPV